MVSKSLEVRSIAFRIEVIAKPSHIRLSRPLIFGKQATMASILSYSLHTSTRNLANLQGTPRGVLHRLKGRSLRPIMCNSLEG
jgi:hypothetical protein